MNNRRGFLAQASASALALATFKTSPAFAQSGAWPSRPIKIIATYQPGGTNDIMARLAAQIWSESLGTSVVVENRPGNNGNLGTELVAHSKPDGYTLLAGTFGPIITSPSLYTDLRYDPIKDFAPVGILATVPNVIVVHPSLPVTSLKEFIQLAKTRESNPLTFGIVPGGTPQFLIENLKKAIGIKLLHVPYKGGTSALNDLLGNHIDLYIDNLPLVLPQIRGKTVRALAVADDQRSAVLKDIPSTKELGFPDVVISAWHGILAPGATPAPIVRRLNETLVAALRTPAIIERITSQGADVVANTPEEFTTFIRTEIPRWGNVIRAAGITAA